MEQKDSEVATTGTDRVDLRAANAALVAIMMATLASNLDSTMVNVALPHIRSDLAPGANVAWVVSAYFLGTVVTLPLVGWLANRFGARRPFKVCLAFFALGGIASASSRSLATLVATRFFQGLTAMAIIPLGMTVVMTVFPAARRGRAIAVWSIAGLSGPAFGPTLGGALADVGSWRLIFLATTPLCVVAYRLASKSLPAIGGTRRPLDVPGLVLGPLGLAALLLSVSQGANWGWSAPETLLGACGGLVLLAVFAWIELRSGHPLLELGIAVRPGFLRAALIIGTNTGIMTTRLVFVPLQLHDVRGYSATRNGLLLLPVAVVMLIATLVSGRVADVNGPRRPIIVGAALLAVGSAWIATWRPTTPIAVVFASMALQAAGNGAVSISCTVLAMSRLRTHELGQGSSLRQLFQQLGGTIAVASAAALLAARLVSSSGAAHAQSVYNAVNIGVTLAAGLCLLGALGVARGLQRPS